MKTIGVKELEARLSEGLAARLDSLAEAGQLTRARLPRKNWSWKVSGLGISAGVTVSLLDELRSDRTEE